MTNNPHKVIDGEAKKGAVLLSTLPLPVPLRPRADSVCPLPSIAGNNVGVTKGSKHI